MDPDQNVSSANTCETDTPDEALEEVNGARPLLDQRGKNIASSAKLKQNIVRKKIEQYFQRLTEGCQQRNCTNPNCASNPKQLKMSGNDAAIKAIELFQKKAEICKMLFENSEKPSSPQSSSNTNHVSAMDYKESDAPSSSKESPMETSDPTQATVFTAARAIPSHSNVLESGLAPSTSFSEEHTNRKLQWSNEVRLSQSEKSVVREIKEIKYLTEEMVIDLINQCRQTEERQRMELKTDEKQDIPNPYLPLVRKVREVFSNVENLNASFLRCADGIRSHQKDYGNWLMQEETKMDIDSTNTDTMLKQTSLPTSDPTNSSSATPFMSFWNSLLNEATDGNTTASAASTVDEYSRSGSLENEVSSLHRAGAIKKKTQPGKSSERSFTILAPTVDIEAVRRVYKLLNGIDCVERTLVKSLEDFSLNLNIQLNILQQMENAKKSKKGNSKNSKTLNLNAFIIVMENDMLHSPEYLENAVPNFWKILASLPLNVHASLAKIWSTYKADRLKKMVQTFQQLLTFKILTMEPSFRDSDEHLDLHKNDVVTSTVKCLKIVYYASLLGGHIDQKQPTLKENPMSSDRLGAVSSLMDHEMDGSRIKHHWKDPLGQNLGISTTNCIEPLVPYEEFENEILNSSLDVYNDFIEYKIERRGTSEFTFMDYPFVLNMVNKNNYLSYDNRIKMISDRRMMVLESILNGTALSPYLRLKIRRDHIIEDSLVRLELIAEDNPADLRKQLYVEFEGEQGVDEGGVSKEFFQLVVEQIFNPDYGMFTLNENTNLFWFNSHSFETKAQFTLIGIVLGLAIYNNCILDVKFPSSVYKKLYGRKADFDDMRSSHPILHNGLKELLLYDGNVEEDMMATFSVEYDDMFGIVHKHELKKGGVGIPVTNQNRKEYVELYADWLLNESIADQFGAFLRGFELVVSQSPLKHLFRSEELEVLISGSQEYDFKSLESTTDYDGGFDKNSQTIVDFWTVVHEMSDENKRKLLQFTTGTDRAPVGGLAQIKLVISRNGPDSDRLPTSHTCFNVILLPDYKNREKLKERLYKAITYSKGFGML